MRAGYNYNPALQNLQCLISGLTDLTFIFQTLTRIFFDKITS